MKQYLSETQKDFIIFKAAKAGLCDTILDKVVAYWEQLTEAKGYKEYFLQSLRARNKNLAGKKYCERCIIPRLGEAAKGAFYNLESCNYRFSILVSRLYKLKMIEIDDGHLELTDDISQRTFLYLYKTMTVDLKKNNKWSELDILFNWRNCKSNTSRLYLSSGAKDCFSGIFSWV